MIKSRIGTDKNNGKNSSSDEWEAETSNINE